MGKNNYILLLLLFISGFIFAQSNQVKYIVYFKDKPTAEDISNLFSEKALAKRQKFNIAFDERDIPVNANYDEILKNENTKNSVVNVANINNIKVFDLVNKIEQIIKQKAKYNFNNSITFSTSLDFSK